MLFLWAIIMVVLIFMWVFFLPLFLLGFLFSVPFFVVALPLSLAIGAGIYLSFDQIKESSIRDIVSSAPFEKWFGSIRCDIPSDKNYLICCHPHGVICTMALCGIHFRPQSKTLVAVAPILFLVPIVGWIAKHLGAIPATYDAIQRALRTTSVILMPGGVPEIVSMEKNQPYEERWGFLKCAKQAAVDIIKVVGKQNYYTLQEMPLYELRMWIAKRYNIPIVFPWIFGWYNTWVPLPKPIWPDILTFTYCKDQSLEQNRERYYNL